MGLINLVGLQKQTGAYVVLPLTTKDANLGAKRRCEWSESDE